METIDTVPAHTLEVGDTISYDGEEIVVRDISDGDIDSVSLQGYSLTHDSVETYRIGYDVEVNILGE